MKRQSIVYLLMFAFAFVLPSFSFPDKDDGKGPVEKTMQSTSDSVVVSVRFNNPKLVVTQDALERKFESQALSNKELIDVVKGFNENFTKLNELQERRYESAMTQLQRRTGYSVGQINKFILQQQRLNTVEAIGFLLYALTLLIIYSTSYRRLRENIVGLLLIFAAVGAFALVSMALFWPMFMGQDYILFYKLSSLPF
jgi:hypothetical protein